VFITFLLSFIIGSFFAITKYKEYYINKKTEEINIINSKLENNFIKKEDLSKNKERLFEKINAFYDKNKS